MAKDHTHFWTHQNVNGTDQVAMETAAQPKDQLLDQHRHTPLNQPPQKAQPNLKMDVLKIIYMYMLTHAKNTTNVYTINW